LRGAADTVLYTLSRAPDSAHPNGHNLRVDLADSGALKHVLSRLDALLPGTVRRAVLINNAGVVQPVGPLARNDPAALVNSVQVNLLAPLLLMRWFAAQAAPRAATAAIINISSGAGRRPIAGWTAYCASKAGLDMASRVVADEAAASGTPLTVTSLSPGIVDTGMQAAIRATSIADFPSVERFQALYAEGALTDPKVIAERILELDATGRLPAGLADLRQL
jgi:NAD(P)-dependent dehydrogenase (short-subunit alcohol dehydrogenase family)